VKGLDQRTPQVSIQAKIIFVDRTDVEELGVKYDLGSSTQFFNKLSSGPTHAPPSRRPPRGPACPTPSCRRRTSCRPRISSPWAATRCRRSATASSGGYQPGARPDLSPAIGNFDLTAFVQALATRRARRHSGPSRRSARSTTGRRRFSSATVSRSGVIDVSSVSTGGRNRHRRGPGPPSRSSRPVSTCA